MEMNETMRNEMENTTKEVLEEVSSNTNDIRKTVVALAGLAIAAGVGYFVYKKKSNKNVVVVSEEDVEDGSFRELEEDEEDK